MAGKDDLTDSAITHVDRRGLDVSRAFDVIKGAVIATRPVQWSKSLLVFLPLAFTVGQEWSIRDTDQFGDLFLKALVGAVIFCALAGGVYIINDLFDLERDKAHPRKRLRPIVSGRLPVGAAQVTAALLLSVSLAGGFLMDREFGIVTVVVLVTNFAYSSWLKRLIIIDVMIVGAGYLLRAVAGALIIDVEVSPWLYATIGLGALFIALGKRHSEFRAAGTNASSQRPVLEHYSLGFLNQLISITSTATLVAYALYTFEAEAVPEDSSMMLTIPFVIFGLFRYLYLVNHTNDAESPEMVIIKDKPLVLAVLLWAATAITVLAVDR